MKYQVQHITNVGEIVFASNKRKDADASFELFKNQNYTGFYILLNSKTNEVLRRTLAY